MSLKLPEVADEAENLGFYLILLYISNTVQQFEFEHFPLYGVVSDVLLQVISNVKTASMEVCDLEFSFVFIYVLTLCFKK